MTITFSFDLDKRALTHLKEQSRYNSNFWRVDWSRMGDGFGFCEVDILHQDFDEFSETCYFSLGRFEGDKFIPMFTWLEENPPLEMPH